MRHENFEDAGNFRSLLLHRRDVENVSIGPESSTELTLTAYYLPRKTGAGASPIAFERIADPYRIETETHGQDVDTRRSARQEKTNCFSQPQASLVQPKTGLAEAIRSALSRQSGYLW